MGNKYLTADAIKEKFDEPVEVSPVTCSVYRVTDPDGSNPRYAKVWLKHSQSELEELVSIDADIGMPPHQLIKGDPHILVMEPVSGDPLPRVLLSNLLPGVWSVHSERLVQAFENLGRTIGRLHSETQEETKSLDPSSLSFDRYDAITENTLATPIQQILDSSVVARLEEQLPRIWEYEIPSSIVHGDLMLFHVYVNDGGNVTLIDFDAAKRVPCIEDPIRFTCALELFIRRLPYARKGKFQRLRFAFEEGYDQTGLPYTIDGEVWKTLRAIRHCSLLMYYHDKLPHNLSTNNKLAMRDRVKLGALRRIDTLLLKRVIRELVM